MHCLPIQYVYCGIMLYIEIPVYQNSTRQDLSSKVMFDKGSL